MPQKLKTDMRLDWNSEGESDGTKCRKFERPKRATYLSVKFPPLALGLTFLNMICELWRKENRRVCGFCWCTMVRAVDLDDEGKPW